MTSWYHDGDEYGVFGQRYDAAGNPGGARFRANTYTTASQYYPSVAAGLADGGFVVTWQSANQDGSLWGVYGQRFDASGAAVGAEFLVNTTTADHQQHPSAAAALADGGFVVTWQSDGQDGSGDGVYGQRFGAAGDPVGAEFRANTHTANDQRDPSVAASPTAGSS